MFTIDKSIKDNMTFDTVRKFIQRHEREFPRLDKLQNYYIGEHDILRRKKDSDVPNNKIVWNHAKEITDTVTGFFVGNPITYTGDRIE